MRVLLYKNEFIVLICLLLFVSCTSNDYLAPVINNNQTYEKQASTKKVVTIYEGDSLYSISKREGVSISSIIKANKLEPPFTLYKGDKLIIIGSKIHQVSKGNTLYDIARCYGVNIAEIRKLNKLRKNDKIYEGRKLLIPINEKYLNAKCNNISKKIVKNIKKNNNNSSNNKRSSYLWPVKGKILSKFGLLANGLRNDGINISAEKGKPVLAADSGKIVYAGNEIQAFGNLILIKHYNNKTSAYAHLDKIRVVKGESVNKGQIIALVGNSGKVSVPQLHFEIRDKEGPLDPLDFLP